MSFTSKAFRGLIALTMTWCCLASAFAKPATTTTKVSVEVTSVVDVIGNGKIDWTKEEIRARGIGLAPKYATTPAQITILAREAAIVAAERNLIKVIYGVHITSETTVENLVLTQDTIKTSVTGYLQGAVIVSEKPYGDNGYEIVLAVNLFGDKSSLSQCVDLAGQFKIANPETTVVSPAKPVDSEEEPVVENPPVPEEITGGYTGLIIDCRGQDMTRSMCPRILDQANANLWGTLTVSAELVNARGIAGYFHSADDPAIVERVGKNPLVVKALRVSGGKDFKTDAVLSPADAELVRSENANALFLEKLNVAFLVDNGI